MIGRKREREALLDAYSSDEAEFISICGKEAVGKTYLVEKTFEGKITFRHTALAPWQLDGRKSALRQQLDHFCSSLRMHGIAVKEKPESWMDAFFRLQMHLDAVDDGSTQLVFIDELAWMDCKGSYLLSALEAFWNSWNCHRKNFKLIVAGSDYRWMWDRLINNCRGLYGRLTEQIYLEPFQLSEWESLVRTRIPGATRQDVAMLHMAFGGLPGHLDQLKAGQSARENIERMIVESDPVMKHRFDHLFSYGFGRGEKAGDILRLLATTSAGLTRNGIAAGLGLSNNTNLGDLLSALVCRGLVAQYVPFGKARNQKHYRIIDPFCLFYLRLVEGRRQDPESFDAWLSDAFNLLCSSHIRQIKKVLGIGGVRTVQYCWPLRGEEKGNFLLIKRADRIINICDLKYLEEECLVEKGYPQILVRIGVALRALIPKRFSIHNTLVTTHGLKRNGYSNCYNSAVVLDDLFAK